MDNNIRHAEKIRKTQFSKRRDKKQYHIQGLVYTKVKINQSSWISASVKIFPTLRNSFRSHPSCFLYSHIDANFGKCCAHHLLLD